MPNPEYVVVIDYANWQGVRGKRTIVPSRIEFDSNDWHKDPQWLLYAYDVDKDAERSFAMKSIHSWAPFQSVEVAPPADENLWLKHCRHANSCFRNQECMYWGCPLANNPKLKAWMAEEASVKTWP